MLILCAETQLELLLATQNSESNLRSVQQDYSLQCVNLQRQLLQSEQARDLIVQDMNKLTEENARLTAAMLHAHQRIETMTVAESKHDETLTSLRLGFASQSRRYEEEISRSSRQLEALQVATQQECDTLRQEISRFYFLLFYLVLFIYLFIFYII